MKVYIDPLGDIAIIKTNDPMPTYIEVSKPHVDQALIPMMERYGEMFDNKGIYYVCDDTPLELRLYIYERIIQWLVMEIGTARGEK